jgi:uncharacterized membrane protein YgdD (TMEM256/DUF423 family)
MHRRFTIAGSLLAGLAVGLGAFGAHGLKKLTTDTAILHPYDTAVQYQMWHAIALLFTGWIIGAERCRLLLAAGWLFLTGTVFFSGSLYLITLSKLRGGGLASAIGPVTPVGGLLLIGGWVCLTFGLLRIGMRSNVN